MNRRRFFLTPLALLAVPAAAAIPAARIPKLFPGEPLRILAAGAGSGGGGPGVRTVVITGLSPDHIFTGKQLRDLYRQIARKARKGSPH